MKLLILIMLLFLSSCSLFRDDPEPTDPDYIDYTYFKTGRFTAPAEFSAPLTELYNEQSKSLKINSGDRIRIRFFDSNIQSIEDTLVVGSDITTLGSVLSRLESAIAATGTTVRFEMDTTKAGYINVIRSAGPLVYNINIENMSHPISDTLMHTVFWWPDEIIGDFNRSRGGCRSYATTSSRLVYLVDSAGGTMGLETGDSIFVRGGFAGQEIESFGRYIPITDQSVTMGSVINFMAGAAASADPPGVEFQMATFTRPHLSGSILMRIQDYDSTLDSLILFSYNANKNVVLPSNFNANIMFERISNDDVWVIDTNGIDIDSLGE